MIKKDEIVERQSDAGRILASLKAAMGGGQASEGMSPIPASAIRVEPTLFQQRHTDEHHIGELSSAIKAHGSVEPLTVILVGADVVLVDGHHRLAAYRRTGRTDAIPVRYLRGTLEEAVLESGSANSKVKLNMSVQERGDCAWRLTLLGGYSKPEIAKASGASTSSVGLMRKAKEALGADAYDFTVWAHARRAAQGKGMALTAEEVEDMIERTASEWANRLHKAFGPKMAEQPEIAARALSAYFGRRVDDLVKELKDHASDELWEEDMDEDIGGETADF